MWNNQSLVISSYETVCLQDFGNGMTLALNMMALLFVLNCVFDWCRDPIALNLDEKVRQLEHENELLVDEVDELRDEVDELTEKLKSANKSLRALRGVLDECIPPEHDTQG